MMVEDQIDISVIICTYNGAERLPETLKHLAAQNTEKEDWEILLINNASTDNTEEVAKEYWQKLGEPVPLKYYYVETPGKSHCLSFASQAAKGKYILICDDDNWLDKNYLRIALNVMNLNPTYGIVGGRAEAVSDNVIPDWFYEVQYAYACGSPYKVSMDVTGIGLLWGAGMVIRTNLAKIILHPDMPTILTGRKGNLLTAGEDDEKCLRTWLTGYKTYFNYQLLLYHFIPEYRLNSAYRDRLIEGFKEQGPIIGSYRRLYDLLQNGTSTNIILFKQLLAYLVNSLKGNADGKRIAADNIFFISGWYWCRSESNKKVMAFYQFMKLKFNSKA